MNLKEAARQLPRKPGVYLMKDSLGNIIYVGKAKDLKNRVSQYFQTQKDRAPKIIDMIQNIHTFEYFVTDTELDAFLEECRLIKEIKPMYNAQMKNDKRYSYIKIWVSEEYPRFTVETEKSQDAALYFGPYTSKHRVENVIQFLKDYYPIRKCAGSGLRKRHSGCLNRQLGACMGVCTGEVGSAQYKEWIGKIILLLEGKDVTAVQDTMKRMEYAVNRLDFEKAAHFRDYLGSLRHVLNKQQLIQSSNSGRNIVIVEFTGDTSAKLFLIKGNRLLYSRLFKVSEAAGAEFCASLRDRLTESFHTGKSADGLTQQDMDEAQIIYSYLKRNKKRILTFWIPNSRLNKGGPELDKTIGKMMDKIAHYGK